MSNIIALFSFTLFAHEVSVKRRVKAMNKVAIPVFTKY